MTTQTLTPESARELCERLGRTPETMARQFEGNALFLESVRSFQGAKIERQNASVFATLETGKAGI